MSTAALAVAPAAPLNLIEKLSAVMAQVERVPKNGWNDFHKYHYATEADITDCVRSAMAQQGVMLIPSVTKNELRTVKNKNGGEEFIATLTVQFTATDGKDKVEFNVIGEGQDRGDKATYKAMTGAIKYALLKLFLIPTGDDPETEGEEKPHAGVRGHAQQVRAAPRPTAPPPAKPAANVAEAAAVLGAKVATEPATPPLTVDTLWAKAGETWTEPERGKRWAAARQIVFAGKAPPTKEWTADDIEAMANRLFEPEDIAF